MKLETERLILRKHKASDYKDLVEGLNTKRVSNSTAAVPHPYTEKDAKNFIKKCLKDWVKKEKTKYPFAIVLKSENKVIGGIDIHDVKIREGLAQTGSWINPKYHRKGYITEAKIAVNSFAFDKLKIRRMHTVVFAHNKASCGVQEKVGYVKEGCMRKHARSASTGKIHDVNVYGLLKSDWKKRLPTLKKELKKKIKSL